MSRKMTVIAMNIKSQLVKDLIKNHIGNKSENFHVLSEHERVVDYSPQKAIFVCEWSSFVDDLISEKRVTTGDRLNGNQHYVIINAIKGDEQCIAETEDVRKIRGIFYTDDSLEIFEKGLAAILKGEIWIPRRVLVVWMAQKLHTSNQRHHDTLSPRELTVLQLIVAGLSNKEISQELFISTNTVKAHLYKIYKKIDVSNRLQAAMWASNNISTNNIQ